MTNREDQEVDVDCVLPGYRAHWGYSPGRQSEGLQIWRTLSDV